MNPLAIPLSRIVLDTNVCLDLFVFYDPRWDRLLRALHSGEVRALTRDDCRREWQRVLHYPQFGLGERQRADATLAYDACVRPFDGAGSGLSVDVQLPICADPDDQKFLELALEARANVLLSKDKALLKLARKVSRLGAFEIHSPQAWMAGHAVPSHSGWLAC